MRIRNLIRRIVPASIRRLSLTRLRAPVGSLDLGSLRRTSPISNRFGTDRGVAIDRVYIERFLGDNRSDVRGMVLEVGHDMYTRQFGEDRVVRSDVLGPEAGPGITLVGDLTCPEDLEPSRFDCVIMAQTMPFIYDSLAVASTLHRVLKPGGVLLATMPGITRISPLEEKKWGHYWSFTTMSADRLFGQVFGPDNVEIASFGNVLTASAFLYGLAAEELTPRELSVNDPAYQVIVGVRAIRAAE